MFYLVTSSFDNLVDGASKLAVECLNLSIESKLIDIKEVGTSTFSSADLLYFLTNDPGVRDTLRPLRPTGLRVVNQNYLEHIVTKSDVMDTLLSHGVSVPKHKKIFDKINLEAVLDEIGLPVYIKNEQHGRVFRSGDLAKCKDILDTLNVSTGWYVEEAVDTDGRRHEKIYVVHGQTFSASGLTISGTIDRELIRAVKYFNLEVASADILIGPIDYYLVDINHCPTLYQSQEAREAFAKFVLSIPGNTPLK